MALINCKECQTEISDVAKVCPKCGAKTEKGKNDNKKLIAIIGSVVAAILLITLIIGLNHNAKTNRLSYKYGHEVIEVLNSYKNGNISARDAGKQLDDLSDIIKDEADKIYDTDFYESHRLDMIYYATQSAYYDLYFRESMPIAEINQCIDDINEQIESYE